jgi:hypothetical protein
MFDMVAGSDQLRSSMMRHYNFTLLQEYWNRDAEAFRKLSMPYYLYK